VATGVTKELFSTEKSRKMAETAIPIPYKGSAEAEDIGPCSRLFHER